MRGDRFPLRRVVIGVIALLARLPTTAAGDARPPALRDVGIEQRLDAQIPLDLEFRDETGQPVRLGQYFGTKPVILSLAYYECPMLCSLVLNGLASALKVLSFDIGDQFEVVTVSFNPTDTPERAAAKKQTYLKAYGRADGARGWHFLTGDAVAIERLTAAVGYHYKFVPEQQQFAHAAGIMVLTPRGRIARYFYGVEFAPRDVRLGLIEAADNRIGSPVDQLLLFCFHYDAATGKYGAAAINAVRTGGALTVLALATFLIVMWRRDHRAIAPPSSGSVDERERALRDGPEKMGPPQGERNFPFGHRKATVRPEEPPSLWRHLEGRASTKAFGSKT